MVSCEFNNENLIEMKIQIENLRAQMRGVQLNGYQRALALDEYYKLLDYVEELEQLTIPAVSGSAFTKEDLKKAYNNGSRQGSVNGMRVARGGEMNVTTFDEWYDQHYRLINKK